MPESSHLLHFGHVAKLPISISRNSIIDWAILHDIHPDDYHSSYVPYHTSECFIAILKVSFKNEEDLILFKLSFEVGKY